MLASHESTTTTNGTPLPLSGMAQWAARMSGGLLASTGAVALIANVTFLRALGFGLPALIAGVAMLVLSDGVGRRQLGAAAACTCLWLLHGLWVLVRVIESGGEPSVAVWVTRIVLAATMLVPALVPRREVGEPAGVRSSG